MEPIGLRRISSVDNLGRRAEPRPRVSMSQPIDAQPFGKRLSISSFRPSSAETSSARKLESVAIFTAVPPESFRKV